MLTLRRPLGLRVLRFVTLVPVMLGGGGGAAAGRSFPGCHSLRAAARPGDQPRGQPVSSRWRFCAFHARPNMASTFIAIRRLLRYEAGEVPAGEHLLITPEGWQKNIAKWTPGRRVTYVGSFAEQGMDYYWVGKGSN